MRAYATTVAIPLPLSLPQVALMILATLGIIYAVEAGDDLFSCLEREIKTSEWYNEADWSAWLAEAKGGLIRLEDAPGWLLDAIKNWAAGFFDGTMYYSAPVTGPDGVPIFNTGDTISPNVAVYAAHDLQQYFILDEAATKVSYYHYIEADGYADFYVFDCFVATEHISGTYYNLSTGIERTFSYGRNEDESLYPGNLSAYYYVTSSYHHIAVDSLQYRQILSRLSSYYRLPDTSEAVKHDILYAYARSGALGTTVIAPQHPEAIVGGVSKVLKEGYSLTDVTVPNVYVPPVSYPGLNDPGLEIEDLLKKLLTGQITLEDFWRLTSKGNSITGTKAPTISISDTTYAVTESGLSSVPTGNLPSPVNPDLDLTQLFPFCIPFDLYEFISLLAAEPRAPVFNWVISVPQLGINYPISVDFSAWDSVAQLFRTLELLAFIIGLAMITRNKILRS